MFRPLQANPGPEYLQLAPLNPHQVSLLIYLYGHGV